MARILDVLKRPETRQEWPAMPRPFRPEAEPVPVPAEDEPVPFIEVGGPRASTRNAPPAATRPVQLETLAATTPAPTVANPLLQVRFQPLPPAFTPPLPARFAQEVVAFHQPAHAVSEQYRRVLCDLVVQSPSESQQVLLFTSPLACAGTTTVLLNLAVTYARQGIGRIALVDTNFQRPAVAARLGLAASPGLQEVLAGLASPTEAVRETAQPNLFALTSGTALQGETALLASETMRQILRDLRSRFQWVFVDAPAWASRPEVIALGAACDAVYLVVPHGRDEPADSLDMLRLLPRHGTPLRGRIVTMN